MRSTHILPALNRTQLPSRMALMNSSSTRPPITSPEDQSATFVELFFDLVFVFAVTQIVGLLHDGLNWVSVGQAVLVFWLVWWAWTQFTWTLDAADTTHPWIELGTLAAVAAAFFMAVALPDAFHAGGVSFRRSLRRCKGYRTRLSNLGGVD